MSLSRKSTASNNTIMLLDESEPVRDPLGGSGSALFNTLLGVTFNDNQRQITSKESQQLLISPAHRRRSSVKATQIGLVVQ